MQKLMKNKKVVIPVGVVILLLLIYLLICMFVQSGDFLRNTTINGIKVGSMTKEEAVDALNQQYQNDTDDLNLTLLANDQKYNIDVKDNVSFNASEAVEKVYQEVNNSFFANGYNYFVHGKFNAAITINDEEKLLEAVQESKILEYDTKVKTQYEIKEKSIVFTKGKDGEKVEQEDVLEKIHNALENYDFKDDIECSLVASKNDDAEMEALHDELLKAAKNATLDKNNNYEIVAEQVGVEYDLDESIQAFHKASDGEKFEVSATIIQPNITKEMLEKNLFKDVLGTYTTKVSGTAVRKNNVRLAGVKCNNVIVLPGEEFSYNQTVGKRTTAAGFGAAGAYVNGETVDTVGGGICQSSSTIYNAVLLANLQITERTNHSYVSSYVPLGQDATVSWGSLDFKFKNNRDYPIKIAVSYSNSRLTCKIYGTDVDGTTVKIVSERLSTTPYQTVYKDDPTLEEGKEKVDVTGYSGAKAQTYRKVYDANGKLISTTKEAYSVYKRRDKVVLRGTKKKEETKPETTKPNTNQETTTPEQNTTPDTTETQETTQ